MPSELLERVRAATGGSPELDAAIHCAVNGYPPPQVHRAIHVPPYTASLDAALSLVERVRPGWMWFLGRLSPDAPVVAELCCEDPAAYAKEEAATPALALLGALLQSLETSDAE